MHLSEKEETQRQVCSSTRRHTLCRLSMFDRFNEFIIIAYVYEVVLALFNTERRVVDLADRTSPNQIPLLSVHLN